MCKSDVFICKVTILRYVLWFYTRNETSEHRALRDFSAEFRVTCTSLVTCTFTCSVCINDVRCSRSVVTTTARSVVSPVMMTGIASFRYSSISDASLLLKCLQATATRPSCPSRDRSTSGVLSGYVYLATALVHRVHRSHQC